MNHSINFSNYLKLEVLFSYEDLTKLLELLKPFEFFNVSGVQESSSLQESCESFLSFYKNYLRNLFEHKLVDPQIISKMFSLSVAPSEDFFHKITFSQNRFLWKPKRSVIQFQPLGLFISSINQELHTKTFAKDVQSFGLKILFPTIYELSAIHQITELEPKDSEYEKFSKIRHFVRHHTQPLILLKGDEKKVTAIRYSHDLKEQILNMKFFHDYGLKVVT
jgi:hypothetical protein